MVALKDNHRTVRFPVSARLEAHYCADSRYYLVNLSEFFPLDLPRDNRLLTLQRRLRPEFLKSNPFPVSADAFTLLSGMSSIQYVSVMSFTVASNSRYC